MCKRLGTQAWIAITIVFTEVLIVLKFDWDLVTIPFPEHIKFAWTVFFCCLLLWMLWQFYVKPHLNRQEKRIKKTN